MQLYHHHHLHTHHHRYLPGFWMYEISVWLHTLGRSMIGVFTPIFLLQLEYSLLAVLFYYMLLMAIDVPSNLVARELIKQKGARVSILTGKASLIGFLMLFSFMQAADPLLLCLLAVFYGVYDAFFFTGHFFLFMKSTGRAKDVGAKTGIFFSLQKFAGLLGPAAGAGIVLLLGRNALLYAGVISILLSIIPLFKIKDFSDTPSKPVLPLKKFFKGAQEKKDYLISAFNGVHASSELVLWPVFIFLVFNSIESVASISIITSITAIIIAFGAGRMKEHVWERMILVGALALAAIWITRMFVDVPLFMFGSIALVAVFSTFMDVALNSREFKRGRDIDPLTAGMLMNMTVVAAKLCLYTLLFLVVAVFKTSMLAATISLIAVIGVHYFFMLWVRRAPGEVLE